MTRKKQTDWTDINRQILAALDLRAEFELLGIDIAGREPKESGWLECHAVGRDDVNASAAVNVETGRYRDLGGEGLSMSFWDLAVFQKRFTRWQDARDHYAAKAGVKLDPAMRDPAEHLVFQPWSAGLVALWVRHKPGVSVEAVQAAGGRLARYRDQYTVIALPIFGPGFTVADPIGWVLWNITGKELPIFRGKGKPPIWAKMKTTGGSEGGLIGQHAIDRLTAADADPAEQLVWKVEGPSDLLTLWSIIPPADRDRHLVLTNSGGANEIPANWMAPLFTGRLVGMIPDADMPGVGLPPSDPRGPTGVWRWATWAAKVASICRVIWPQQLGYETAKDHGKDLRDWIIGDAA
jgi:hypothetical protein